MSENSNHITILYTVAHFYKGKEEYVMIFYCYLKKLLKYYRHLHLKFGCGYPTHL